VDKEGGTTYGGRPTIVASIGRVAGRDIDKLASVVDWNAWLCMRISSAAAGWVEYMVFYDIVYISRQTLFVYYAATLVPLPSCDPIPLCEMCVLVHPAVPRVQCLHIWERASLEKYAAPFGVWA